MQEDEDPTRSAGLESTQVTPPSVVAVKQARMRAGMELELRGVQRHFAPIPRCATPAVSFHAVWTDASGRTHSNSLLCVGCARVSFTEQLPGYAGRSATSCARVRFQRVPALRWQGVHVQREPRAELPVWVSRAGFRG